MDDDQRTHYGWDNKQRAEDFVERPRSEANWRVVRDDALFLVVLLIVGTVSVLSLFR